jgi:hypothetical protein
MPFKAQALKLGPIGACTFRAGLVLHQRTLRKHLVFKRFIRFSANEKSAGRQDHTTSPSARSIARPSAPLASIASRTPRS